MARYWLPLMLPYESSGSWERRGFAHEVVDLAGQVALDAADDLELGVTLGGLAGGGGQRSDAAQHGEGGLGADAGGVVAQGDQDLPGDLDADAGAGLAAGEPARRPAG